MKRYFVKTIEAFFTAWLSMQVVLPIVSLLNGSWELLTLSEAAGTMFLMAIFSGFLSLIFYFMFILIPGPFLIRFLDRSSLDRITIYAGIYAVVGYLLLMQIIFKVSLNHLISNVWILCLIAFMGGIVFGLRLGKSWKTGNNSV
ncbi:MAG: hypothetical protein AAGA10_29845 [Bacteroidota bacterium]